MSGLHHRLGDEEHDERERPGAERNPDSSEGRQPGGAENDGWRAHDEPSPELKERGPRRAAPGALSPSFMFDRVGQIVYAASAGSVDKVLEAAIEAGADDARSDDEGHVVTCAFSDLGDVAKALEQALGEAETVKAVWQPQTMTTLDEDKAATMVKLIGALEDDDDVQAVYSNFEVSQQVLEKLMA